MRKLVGAAAAALLALIASSASAEERITTFISDVQIQPDSSLDVTETIDVHVENVRINHGIFRDFPTRYEGRNGSQVRVGFQLSGVTRDGAPEPAAIEPLRNGIRIRIGSADLTVPEGDHRYVIRYRTTRQIGRFPNYDELYWNVTGNGWVFPIEVAEVHMQLPAAVPFGQRAFYTGPQGSTARNAEVIDERPGEIGFRTTSPLGPYEGLTVAAAFPKGVVGDGGEASRIRWLLEDYGPLFLAALLLGGLAFYYYVAWQRAGRDPRPGVVVPIFSPPDELSPAGMRYVWKMGADNRAFAAALVDMGVRGHLRMVEEDPGWFSQSKTRLERIEGATQPLPPEESAALNELAVMPGMSVVMEQKNHEKFSSAQQALASDLKNRYEGRLFNKNWGWAIAGVVLFVASIWLTSAAIVAATGSMDLMMVGTSLGAFALTVLFILLIHEMGTIGKILLSLGAFVTGAGALILGAPIIPAALQIGWWQPLLVTAVAIPLVISAFMWIDAPTREGRAVLDRVMGFRQYLSITERDRLDRMNPPKDTPELFEKYLPFAIALGVENRWADRFAGVLAAAAVAPGHQQFGWYSGSHSPWSNPGAFVGRVGSSLATAVTAASIAPGGRSGSGGGGFSGGGGGGGGGGGW